MTQKLSKTSIVLLAVLAVLCLALAMLPMGKVNAATATSVSDINGLINAVGTAAATSTPAEIKLTEDVYYGTEESPKDTALKIPAQMVIGGQTYPVPQITIDLDGHTLHMYTTSNANFGISNSKFTIKNGKIVASSTTYMAIFGEVTEDQAVDVTVQDVEITYTATGGTKTSVLFANNSKVNVSLNGVSYNTNVDIVRTAGTIDYASVFHGETLQDKVNLTNVYNTITLDRDYNESIVIPAGRGLTIDLGGYTLTNEAGKHTVENYGTLTIKGNGRVDNVSNGCAAVLNRESGIIRLEGGDYTRSKEDGIKGSNSFYVLQNFGTMTINPAQDNEVAVYAGSNAQTDLNQVYSSLVTTGYQDPSKDTCAEGDPVLNIYGGKFYGGKITVKCDEKGTLNSLTGSLTTVGKELRNDVAAVAADLAVLADRIDGAATSDSVTDVASAVSKIAFAIAALQQDVDSIANQVSASEAVETQKATAKTEILTWLNDYVDGITGGATAKASVGRLFMATANAATASDQSDLYTKLEGAFGADNARLVLKYYNEAISAIDSALTVSDVTTAVSTFKAQVASVEAASGNATDLTVVYVLLAVAVVLVIVLLIMVAARKSDKGEAAATAEEPARQTEEAQPEAQPVAQPVEEQPKQPEPQTSEDDDREQVVISANVRTFEEALDELEEDPRKLFDDVLNYALTKPDAVKVQRSNGLVVKQNGKQIVKLTVKRGNPVALFVLEKRPAQGFPP